MTPAVTPPRFEVSARYWACKPGNLAADWEDAFSVSPGAGLAVVTDGASAGIFCREWARTLADRFVRDRPPTDWGEWVRGCSAEWRAEVTGRPLRTIQLRKLAEVGAGAALLGLSVGEPADTPQARPRWRMWCVGDCSMFLVRDGRLRASFPFRSADQFPPRPDLITTNAHAEPRVVIRGGCYLPGDVFILTSDAVARWLLREGGWRPNGWGEVADYRDEDWRSVCERGVSDSTLTADDYTVVALRIPTSPACPS